MSDTFFDFPLRIDGRGRIGLTDADDHVRDLIKQVLFTNPGERVNRPDFGCGLKSLLFMPNSEILAAATQTMVKSALQRWLELEIQVEKVEVTVDDARLVVTVVYTRRTDGVRDVATFESAA